MTDPHKSAGNARKQHVGAKAIVLAALASGPLSRNELVAATGLPITTIGSVLASLRARGGNVVAAGWQPRRYELISHKAVPVRYREFVELRRNPMAHMELAMETRK